MELYTNPISWFYLLSSELGIILFTAICVWTVATVAYDVRTKTYSTWGKINLMVFLVSVLSYISLFTLSFGCLFIWPAVWVCRIWG